MLTTPHFLRIRHTTVPTLLCKAVVIRGTVPAVVYNAQNMNTGELSKVVRS